MLDRVLVEVYITVYEFHEISPSPFLNVALRSLQGGVVKKIKDITSVFFFRSTPLPPPPPSVRITELLCLSYCYLIYL